MAIQNNQTLGHAHPVVSTSTGIIVGRNGKTPMRQGRYGSLIMLLASNVFDVEASVATSLHNVGSISIAHQFHLEDSAPTLNVVDVELLGILPGISPDITHTLANKFHSAFTLQKNSLNAIVDYSSMVAKIRRALTANEGTRSAKREARTAEGAMRSAQRAARSAQRAVRSAQRATLMAQRTARIAYRAAQRAARSALRDTRNSTEHAGRIAKRAARNALRAARRAHGATNAIDSKLKLVCPDIFVGFNTTSAVLASPNSNTTYELSMVIDAVEFNVSGVDMSRELFSISMLLNATDEMNSSIVIDDAESASHSRVGLGWHDGTTTTTATDPTMTTSALMREIATSAKLSTSPAIVAFLLTVAATSTSRTSTSSMSMVGVTVMEATTTSPTLTTFTSTTSPKVTSSSSTMEIVTVAASTGFTMATSTSIVEIAAIGSTATSTTVTTSTMALKIVTTAPTLTSPMATSLVSVAPTATMATMTASPEIFASTTTTGTAAMASTTTSLTSTTQTSSYQMLAATISSLPNSAQSSLTKTLPPLIEPTVAPLRGGQTIEFGGNFTIRDNSGSIRAEQIKMATAETLTRVFSLVEESNLVVEVVQQPLVRRRLQPALESGSMFESAYTFGVKNLTQAAIVNSMSTMSGGTQDNLASVFKVFLVAVGADQSIVEASVTLVSFKQEAIRSIESVSIEFTTDTNGSVVHTTNKDDTVAPTTSDQTIIGIVCATVASCVGCLGLVFCIFYPPFKRSKAAGKNTSATDPNSEAGATADANESASDLHSEVFGIEV